ncbi:MAG: hypothetical protein B6I17_02075 [Tenericutes bacterium 4572_104]|nr:MAG: hypothetical protein B6I17_02075 [Tenericutes bacterium 4572_104]
MKYTREQMICKLNDFSTFYQKAEINYKGKTENNELYNEIVAEYILESKEGFNGIRIIERNSYIVESHANRKSNC